MRKAVIGVAILVILVLALPFLIPADFVRAKLAAQVQEATGRALTISGPVRFRLVPGLGVTAEGVIFANAPGGIAVYLMSDAASYHTGDSFVIDGGYSLF